jgi:glutathione S-transferase
MTGQPSALGKPTRQRPDSVKLIGLLDSPYVRRTAIALQFMEVDFEHIPLSVFREYQEFSQINPVVKAPTLVCDRGGVLMDSSLIIQYAAVLSRNAWSTPPKLRSMRSKYFQLEGLALVAMEKAVGLVLEDQLRPQKKRHVPWKVRIGIQLGEALGLLNEELRGSPPSSLLRPPNLPEVTAAVAWTFCKELLPDFVRKNEYPYLERLAESAETLEEFLKAPHGTKAYPVLSSAGM